MKSFPVRMMKSALATALSLALVAPVHAAPNSSSPKIEIAMLLDTSGSMDGLIAQARRRLWRLINETGKARKNGQTPTIEVALYEYGSGTVTAKDGFLRQIVGLTTAHDQVGAELFALKAKGSEEYMGLAIQHAMSNLRWSKTDADFRTIFVAGNETILQGPVPARDAAAAARRSDIVVNTIYANNEGGNEPGARPSPVAEEWRSVADSGGGTFAVISPQQAPDIKTPYDADLVASTDKLELTFLPFGQRGFDAYKRMRELNRDISRGSASDYADRGGYMAGDHFDTSWDLVDAIKEPGFKLENVAEKDLPEILRGKSLAQKLSIIRAHGEEREKLKAEIRRLGALRETFIAAELGRREEEAGQNLEKMMVAALREQLRAKGFQFVD